MGIREWDRKAKALKLDLNRLTVRYGRFIRQNEQQLRTLQLQLAQLQQSLETRLSWIHTLTHNRSFLSGTEKVLLHWARSLSDKTQDYYREHSVRLQEVFWAKMAWIRAGGLQASEKNPTSPTYSAYHQKEMSFYNKQLAELSKRRASLDQRYHYVAVIRANRDAANPENPKVTGLEEDWLGGEFHSGVAGKSVAPEALKSDALNFLELKPSSVGEEPDSVVEPVLSGPSNSPERSDDDDFIKSFDYLNLDDDEKSDLYS